MPDESKSFWQTVPGIVTAVATLLGAIGTFIVTTNQQGCWGGKPHTDSANEAQLKQLNEKELRVKQLELDTKIKELEEKIGSQPTAPKTNQRNTPYQETAQIGGTWYSADGSYISISQNGVAVTFEQYYNLYGVQTRTGWGQGTVITKKAFIDFIDIYGNQGRSEVTLSDDQQSLGGVARYGNGYVANIYLTRAQGNNE
jgi:hypothetical protein